jgi:hypothetical protein
MWAVLAVLNRLTNQKSNPSRHGHCKNTPEGDVERLPNLRRKRRMECMATFPKQKRLDEVIDQQGTHRGTAYT